MELFLLRRSGWSVKLSTNFQLYPKIMVEAYLHFFIRLQDVMLNYIQEYE
jgi:hypothetical protein